MSFDSRLYILAIKIQDKSSINNSDINKRAKELSHDIIKITSVLEKILPKKIKRNFENILESEYIDLDKNLRGKELLDDLNKAYINSRYPAKTDLECRFISHDIEEIYIAIFRCVIKSFFEDDRIKQSVCKFREFTESDSKKDKFITFYQKIQINCESEY